MHQVSSECLLCRGVYTKEYESRFGATEFDGHPGVPVHCNSLSGGAVRGPLLSALAASAILRRKTKTRRRRDSHAAALGCMGLAFDWRGYLVFGCLENIYRPRALVES